MIITAVLKSQSSGTWLVLLVDLEVVSSSPTLEVDFTLKK